MEKRPDRWALYSATRLYEKAESAERALWSLDQKFGVQVSFSAFGASPEGYGIDVDYDAGRVVIEWYRSAIEAELAKINSELEALGFAPLVRTPIDDLAYAMADFEAKAL